MPEQMDLEDIPPPPPNSCRRSISEWTDDLTNTSLSVTAHAADQNVITTAVQPPPVHSSQPTPTIVAFGKDMTVYGRMW